MKAQAGATRFARVLALLFALSGTMAMLFASSAAGAAIPGATYDGSVPEATSAGSGDLSLTVSPDGGAISSVSLPHEIEGSFGGGTCTFFFYPPSAVSWPIVADAFSFSGTLGGKKMTMNGTFTGSQGVQGTVRVYETMVGCSTGDLPWSAATTATPPAPADSPIGSPAATGPAGRALVAGVALYEGGKAMLRMRCPGADACRGVATLWANRNAGAKRGRASGHERRGKKNARVLVARARFAIAAGKSRRVSAKLTQAGRRLLRRARRHRLRTQLNGRGVKHRTVLLKPAARK